jgi:hypothetical protein
MNILIRHVSQVMMSLILGGSVFGFDLTEAQGEVLSEVLEGSDVGSGAPSSPSTTRPSSPSTTRPPVVTTTTSPTTSTTGTCAVYSAVPDSCTPSPNFEDQTQRQAIVDQCNQSSGTLIDPELTAGDKWQTCQVKFARCHCYDVQGVALYYRSGLCACLKGVNNDYCICHRNCRNSPNPGRCMTESCGPAAAAATNTCNNDWRPGMTHGSVWAGFWNQTGCAASLAVCATLGVR